MTSDEFKNITIQQMESLINLAQEHSFSRAAKKMHLTQPSLTKHIQNLEEIVDARVVNREKKGVSLTLEGKIIYDCSRRVFKLIDEAKEKIAKIREDESGCIYVSASTIPAAYIIPSVLQSFRNHHSDIQCYVQMNDSEASLDMVLNGEAEIGFVGREILNSKLRVEPLWEDRLVLAVPGVHRWRNKKIVTLEEVRQEPFIVREKGSATRTIFDEYLQQHTGKNINQLNIICELGSSEAIKEAIIAGLGVSILSIHAIRRELQNGVLIEVPMKDCKIKRDFYLIYKKQFNLMKHHSLFIDFVKNYRLNPNL